jgi:U2 small nuclear ribonucleoprotein B''
MMSYLFCSNSVFFRPHSFRSIGLMGDFFRYQGFQTTQVTWSPTPNAAGVRVKMAQVSFETPDLASVAKVALDSFTLKKGWLMSVVYI